MNEPRILRLIPFFYPYVTGPANQAYHIARRLTERGFDSPIWTTDHRAADAPSHEVMDGIEVTRLHESLGIMAYRYVQQTSRLCDEPADIIHAHCYRNHLTTHAHRLARRRGLPYVIQPHGTLLMYRHILPRTAHWPYHGYDLITRKREVTDADAVVVATTQERDETQAFGVAPERIHVLPVGAEVLVRTAPPGGGERLILLFVGRITPDRNVEQVLRAFAQTVHNHHRPMTLRIVGPGAVRSTLRQGDRYLQRMRSLAEKLNIAQATEFVGPLYGQALRDAYGKADIFVYTSAYENFGQTMLEAAAAGLPLVVANSGVARDLVRDGETGFVVPFNDISATAERLITLASDDQLLRSMSVRLVEKVKQDFNWNAIIDGYVQLYRSILDSNTRQR